MSYIIEKNKEFASNIDEFNINEVVLDKNYNNSECIITNKTSNSIEVYITKNLKNIDDEGKCRGIDSKQYFTIFDFNKRFTKK